jgi:hypothetical protein
MSGLTRSRSFRLTAPAFLALTIAAAGCGDGSDAETDAAADSMAVADTTPSPEAMREAATGACALATREQVQAALGEPVGEPQIVLNEPGTAETASVTQCRYQSTASTRSISIMYRISPVQDNSDDAIRSVRESVTIDSIVPEDVSGVGDAAFWAANQMHVFVRGNRYAIVTVDGVEDPAAARLAATSVAQDIVEKM